MFKILDHEAISFTFLHEANLFVEFSGKSNNFITFQHIVHFVNVIHIPCRLLQISSQAGFLLNVKVDMVAQQPFFKKNKLTCTLIFQLNKLHRAAGIFEI